MTLSKAVIEAILSPRDIASLDEIHHVSLQNAEKEEMIETQLCLNNIRR